MKTKFVCAAELVVGDRIIERAVNGSGGSLSYLIHEIGSTQTGRIRVKGICRAFSGDYTASQAFEIEAK